jgi:hypothetical protein
MGKPLPFGEIKLACLQFLGALVEPHFRSLAILNIDARSIPLNNLAASVASCYFVVQHPAMLAVRSQNASFMQEGFAAGKRSAPPFHDSFDVLGMDERCPLPALQILDRAPYVPEPCLIEEIQVPVWPTRVNQAGGRMNQELKIRGLIPSSGAISVGGHGSHYIPYNAL